MRLDRFLVDRGFFDSRQKAKEAIKRGFVVVDGRVITKPSYDVKFDSEVRVLVEGKPRGYWKLKEIDEEWNVIREGDVVLDLGSSAGGFLLYASEKAKMVYGIEVSREFERVLKEIERERRNVKVFIEDVFKFDPNELEKLDVILSDLTLRPSIAVKATFRFLEILKPYGRVLFVMKTGLFDEKLEFEGLRVLKVKDSKERMERYYLLEKS